MNRVDDKFLSALQIRLPQLDIRVGADDRLHYGRDWTRFHVPDAGAVVLPRHRDEIAVVLEMANAHRIGVVPSAGRTGLAAGAVVTDGGLALSVERLNTIGDVDVASMTVPVGAGAILANVQQRAQERGLYFPVDLGARGSCQIGGNISTNAGGLRVLRYGSMRQWVLGLTVALPSGELLTLNGALEKNNTGFDLRQLFIGGEGTLGVVTDAVLKLTRPPGQSQVVLFALSSFARAIEVLKSSREAALPLLSFEFFSDQCRREVESHTDARSPFANPSPCYALVEAEVGDGRMATWLVDESLTSLVDDAVVAGSAKQARGLWALRERITESLATRRLVHKSDVAVAGKDLAAFVEVIETRIAREHPRLELFLFGHVGDGNVHINLPLPTTLDEKTYRDDVKAADRTIAEVLESFHGSVSAEHGIGLLKIPLLCHSRSATEIDAFRGVKKIFDPNGIMNPGKLIP